MVLATSLMSECLFSRLCRSFNRNRVFLRLQGLPVGQLYMTLPNGRTRRFGNPEHPLQAHIHIHDQSFWRDLVKNGAPVLFTSYAQGQWSTDNMEALCDLLTGNAPFWARYFPLQNQPMFVLSLAEKFNNTFFAQWLDVNLAPSCAIFPTPESSLQQAQNAKYASICDRLGLDSSHKMLDINPSFGGLALYAAKHYGVRVTLLVDSVRHKNYLETRIQSAGLESLIDVNMLHVKDMPQKYDRIAVMEYLERIDEKARFDLFKVLNNALVPGGRVEMQSVVLKQAKPMTYKGPLLITPMDSGHRPATLGAIQEYIKDANLLDLGHISIGEHYPRTLDIWHRNFNEKWDQIAMLGHDDAFRRLWSFGLLYCAASFKSGIVDVIQKSIVKPYDPTTNASPA